MAFPLACHVLVAFSGGDVEVFQGNKDIEILLLI